MWQNTTNVFIQEVQNVTNGLLGSLAFLLNIVTFVCIIISRSLPARQKVVFLSLIATDFTTSLIILMVRAVQFKYESDHFLCHIRLYTSLVVMFVTILSNLLNTTERFLSMALPLHLDVKITWKHLAVCVLLCWVFAIVATFSFFWEGFGGIEKCQFMVIQHPRGYMFLAVFICVNFLIIIAMYAYITRVTRRHIRQIAATIVDDSSSENKRRTFYTSAGIRITVTVGIIVCVFGISYVPLGVYVMYSVFNMPVDQAAKQNNQTVYAIIVTLLLMNSMVNPVIYILRFKKCRDEMIARFWCCSRINLNINVSSEMS
ncbi:hypothetical protein SNE40_002117 [Patella caerulea]|uniref:G-protein coupled receptors family 1 profile domain-containing protein n=1 Tax=Patella caerulea TaxID=87958 RepID=A0AAN8K746_PATCE